MKSSTTVNKRQGCAHLNSQQKPPRKNVENKKIFFKNVDYLNIRNRLDVGLPYAQDYYLHCMHASLPLLVQYNREQP